MQGQTRGKQLPQLPKIHSQKRIYTASDRRNTEQDKALANRPLSNNGRTRSLRAFTTKSVKYESTSNIYNKKVQEIQKHSMLVERQIKNVQDEISSLRQTIGNAKKQSGMSRLTESGVSYMSKLSTRKAGLLADQQAIKNELKNLEAKILGYRNKIDTHLQKNKAIEQQIDAYRKQISTLKNINFQLEASFKLTSVDYDQQLQESRKLDILIAQKTQLTHKKKVQNMHQKAQMIKQYDVILKTLDKELNTEKPAGDFEEKSNFYLTDVLNQQIQPEITRSAQKQSNRQIISAKKPRINEIKEKLKNYERQFEQLKAKVGSQNIQQITKKFTEEYQNNFHEYNFINEMYKEYEDANLQQFELLQKKNALLKELEAEKSTSKVKQIHEFKEKIGIMNKKKDKIRKDMLLYNKIALEIKVYLGQYLNSQNTSQAVSPLFEELTDKTVAKRLYEIYEKHSKDLLVFSNGRNREKRSIKNTSTMGKDTIDDLIDEVKKQSQASKDNKLLTRQELQKNTIELKEKKMEGSMNTAKLKAKREAEKSSRNDFYKKATK